MATVEEDSAEAMPSKQSEQRLAVKVLKPCAII